MVQASSWKPWGFLVGHTVSVSLFLSLETGPLGSLQGPPASAWQEEDGSCQKVLSSEWQAVPISWDCGSLVVVELFNALAGHRVHPQQRGGWGTGSEGGVERIGGRSSIVGQDGACDSVHLTRGPMCNSVL